MDDPTSATGVKRYPQGREPILTRDGQRLVDRCGRGSYVTSAGSGPSVGKYILLQLPAARAGQAGHAAGRGIYGRAIPGDRGGGGQHAAVRSGQFAYEGLIGTRWYRARSTHRPFSEKCMNILVCVKRVPATGSKIVLTADSQDIDTRYLGFTISPHEECAVEEAVRIVEAQGGSSTVLTLGPEAAAEQLRDAMALGIDNAILLETDGRDWDAGATAGAIVAAIRTERRRASPST